MIRSFLYQVSPVDAGTYAAVVVLLVLVGAVAAALPAQRAASVQPMEALREE